MKWFKNLKEERWFQLTLATCSAVTLFFIFSHIELFIRVLSAIWKVFLPVFVGIIFAYMMDPIARFFERTVFKNAKHKKITRRISIFISAIAVFAVLVILLVVAIPPLISSAVSIAGLISNAWMKLENEMEGVINIFGIRISFDSLNGVVNSFFEKLSSGESQGVNSIIKTSYNFGTGFVTAVLGYILAIYFMSDKETLQAVMKKLLRKILKPEQYLSFAVFCKRCDKILLKYLACDLLEGFIVGVANAVFMAICGMPYIGLVSVVVGVTNLAPTFGPLLGAVIGSIVLLLSNNPWYVLWFLIFTVVLQTIDGYIIKPNLFGDTLGVSALLILVTIIVGGRLFGTVGILLSIPAAAIAQFAVKDYLLKKPISPRKKNKKDEKESAEKNEDNK